MSGFKRTLTPIDPETIARQLGDDDNMARGKWTHDWQNAPFPHGYIGVRALDDGEITPKMKLRAEHRGVEIWY